MGGGEGRAIDIVCVTGVFNLFLIKLTDLGHRISNTRVCISERTYCKPTRVYHTCILNSLTFKYFESKRLQNKL